MWLGTCLSAAIMENCAPSREASREHAVVLALARAYRSVSSLKRKATASLGNFRVVPDQYSITPA